MSLRPNAQFLFDAAANYVVCDTLETTFSGTQGLGSVKLNSDQNVIRLIRTNKARIICGTRNCLGGAALGWYGQDTADGYAYYALNGTAAQTAAYLTSDEFAESASSCYSISNNPASSTATVLSLTGGVAEATAYCKLIGKFSLVVGSSDGAAFKQRLLNRAHTMAGPITVNANTTLALGGGTTFENVKDITVNGGLLEIEDGRPFENYAVSLNLNNGGQVKLPADFEWRVTKVMVDGAEVSGKFTKDSARSLVVGDGTLVAIGSEPETLVWAATDAAATLSTAANWKDGPTFDFEVPEKYDAVFAEAGARAVVDAAVNLRSMTFDAPTADGFTLVSGNDGAVINLGGGGLVSAIAEGEARNYLVDAPLVAATGEQHWTLGTNATVKLTNFTADVPVTLDGGHGTLALYGTTTLNAPLKNWYTKSCASTDKVTDDMGRTLFLTGRVEGEGEVNIYGWNGCYVVLSNVVVAAPFKWQGDGSHGWAYEWFSCAKGTTNEISGPITAGAAAYIVIRKNAELTFSGGVSFGNKISVNAEGGTLIIKDKPALTTAGFTDNNAFLGAWSANSRVVLDVADNQMARCIAQADYSVMEFRKDYAISEACVKNYQRNCLDLDGSSALGLFELNATRQRVRFINGQKPNKATIHGVYPAALEVYDNSTNRSPITGYVSLEKLAFENGLGADKSLVLGGQAFESAGDVKVAAGALEFETGATWLNGTNVTVCGTGTLKLNAGGVFSGRHAVLHVAGEGKLALAASQAFCEGWVEDAEGHVSRLRAGTYTAANPGALAGHFAEGAQGSVVIRNLGSRVILR